MNWLSNQKLVNELRIENALRPEGLEKLSKSKWPPVKIPENLKEVWRSRYYLIQVFKEANGIERLSICISDAVMGAGRFKDGLSWEQLQDIKRQIGRGDKEAVEIYPKDCDIVNVANMRHLWVMRDDLPFVWREKKKT